LEVAIMNKPLWKVGDLVKIKHHLAIILKVHTKSGDGFHYLVSEGDTNKAKWLRETHIQSVKNEDGS
tara:strand:- start:174 stop:374 length:201 start_codon:yes stop_codon:yes gene_type:complete